MRFFFLFLTIIAGSATAQKFEFAMPVRLDKQINTNAEELAPILSQDGKTLYFSRALDPANTGGELGGIDIWMSIKDQNGHWQTSSNKLNGWNNKDNNAVIGTSKDNSVVYMLNAYKNQNGIAFSKNLNGKWTEPEIVDIPGRKTSEFVGYYMNPTFDVLLISMKAKDSYGQEDLFVSSKDSLGRWNSPVNLGSTINTDGYELSPFLSADGRRLYFASNGHEGFGDADIFYSDRLYNSWEIWSKPVNLGDKINSPSFDAYFSMYGDSLAFFSSNRDSELADIFMAKATLKSQSFDEDRQYLTNEEVSELIGKVSSEIRFDQGSATLNAAQNELLFYIVNKVITKTDINFQLAIGETGTPGMVERRLAVVTEKLKLLGISSYRIFEVKPVPGKNLSLDGERIILTFFR